MPPEKNINAGAGAPAQRLHPLFTDIQELGALFKLLSPARCESDEEPVGADVTNDGDEDGVRSQPHRPRPHIRRQLLLLLL